MKRCCSASGVPSSRRTGTLTKAMAFVFALVAADLAQDHLKLGTSSLSSSLDHWPFPSDGPGSGCRACRVRVLAGDHTLDAARAGVGAVVARGAARTRAGAVPASDTCGAGGGPTAVQVDLPGGAVGACGRAGRAGVLATFCADKDTYTAFRLLRNGQIRL